MEFVADSPREAAEMAVKVHRDPSSIATVFSVIDIDGNVTAGPHVFQPRTDADPTWKESSNAK
jgi:hypothetical protein